jgi:hypothetical protein
MLPNSFVAFFAASAGAGAALVGLLFVAISVDPERIVAPDAPIERQAMAASTFTALLNAFFISLVALIPDAALAGITIVMSSISLLNSLYLAWSLFRHWRGWRALIRGAFLIVVGLAIYAYELYAGIVLARANSSGPSFVSTLSTLAFLVVAVYGIGLTRAWQLLGARRYGLGGWFSVLREVAEDEPSAVTGVGSRATPSVSPACNDDERQ